MNVVYVSFNYKTMLLFCYCTVTVGHIFLHESECDSLYYKCMVTTGWLGQCIDGADPQQSVVRAISVIFARGHMNMQLREIQSFHVDV